MTAVGGLRVLVAGARGGIGGACVELLEREGHLVVGVDRPPGPHAVDVTVPDGAERAVEIAEAALGGLDGIVHAIGMSGRRLGDGPVASCTDTAWAEVLRVNLESAFRLMRAGLPALERGGGGSFVTIGSVLGQSADPDFMTAAERRPPPTAWRRRPARPWGPRCPGRPAARTPPGRRPPQAAARCARSRRSGRRP
jgi:NAD(P)-dependent dehydrogenase (short-subunit alcohol dehydrogenase family)